MTTRTRIIALLLGSTLLWAVPAVAFAYVCEHHLDLPTDSVPLKPLPAGEKEAEDAESNANELEIRSDLSLGVRPTDTRIDHGRAAVDLTWAPPPVLRATPLLSRPPPAIR